MTTRSQDIANDVAALLRARNPVLWVVTREEARAEQYLAEAALVAKYIPHTWDCGQGAAYMDGTLDGNIEGSTDIGETLKAIASRAASGDEKGLWILRDLPAWIVGPAGAMTLRQLRNRRLRLPATDVHRLRAGADGDRARRATGRACSRQAGARARPPLPRRRKDLEPWPLTL